MDEREPEAISRKRTFEGRGGLISRAVNKAIDILPWELSLPGGFRYCGPGTRLKERLARGDKGINPLDEACKLHDIEYAKHSDSENRRQADSDLAERAWRRVKASDASIGEKVAAWTVTTAMKAKAKIGAGKKKKSVKRKMKQGGVLPLLPIFAGLSTLGSLVGGAAGVAKVITDSKIAKKRLEELKRHNLAMEGKGVYLKPYKGQGKKKKRGKKRSSR